MNERGGLRAFSYGGGVQSTAALVLAAEGKIDFRVFLFSNVGADSEHPDTLRYIADVAVPYAAEHGIELIEVQRRLRNGDVAPTLYEQLLDPASRSIPIPMFLVGETGVPGNRSCTADYKIKVIGRWLREQGVKKENPAIMGVGISTDEIERAKPGTDKRSPLQYRVYPLLDMGISRADCHDIISRAGLPAPGKSACWFCPYHRPSAWRLRKRDEPELFERAVQLERVLHERGDRLGRDNVFLTRFVKPLDEAISPDGDQLGLDLGSGDCESGYCMT